jgi:hypothetical protein
VTHEARRLGRAIDWLDLAWRTTTSIDDDTRDRRDLQRLRE